MALIEIIDNGMLLNVNADNFEMFAKKIGDKLSKAGYVKSDFTKALIERENKYPTGIITNGTNIAFPHVDSRYVNTNALIICNLKPGISFHRMDAIKEEITAEIAFVLLIKDPKLQVKAISELTKIWSNETILQKIKIMDRKEELEEMIQRG